MRLPTKILSVALVLAWLVAPAALAAEGQFYVAPGLQWMEFDDTTGLKQHTNYFLGIGYDFTDRPTGRLTEL